MDDLTAPIPTEGYESEIYEDNADQNQAQDDQVESGYGELYPATGQCSIATRNRTAADHAR